MQPNIDVGILLNEMIDCGQSLGISPDINNVNSAIFVLRRGPWTTLFFAEMRKIRPVLARQTITLPLKYENRAFFLTGMWPTDCIGVSRIDTWLAPNYHMVLCCKKAVCKIFGIFRKMPTQVATSCSKKNQRAN